MSFKDDFKAARKLAGLTQAGAAAVLNVSARTVFAIESGETVPPEKAPPAPLTQGQILAKLKEVAAKQTKPKRVRVAKKGGTKP